MGKAPQKAFKSHVLYNYALRQNFTFKDNTLPPLRFFGKAYPKGAKRSR